MTEDSRMDNDGGIRDAPKVVYHYTTTAGLLGILSNRELWLGDVEFMNDAEELAYAKDKITRSLEAKAHDLRRPDEGRRDRRIRSARAGIINNVLRELRRPAGDVAVRSYHVYAACFCESPDLLSQWRGYANEGGYAIGFKTDALASMCLSGDIDEPMWTRLLKVHYGLAEAETALTDLVKNVAPSARAFPGAQGWTELMDNVLPVLATVKHPSFAEEKEWRLLQLSWGISSAMSFRASSIGLVPYLTRPLPNDAIERIVVGPGNHRDLRRAGVAQLLAARKIEVDEIAASAAPYRS
jgi:hypothetical protein